MNVPIFPDFLNVFNCVLSDVDVEILCGLFASARQRGTGAGGAKRGQTANIQCSP